MKNKDLLLKYESGLLTVEEKNELENRLKTDSKLSAEFYKLKSSLEKIAVDENSIDQRYFNNLLPRVRENIDAPSRNPKLRMVYSLSGVFTALLVFLIVTGTPNPQFSEFNYLVQDYELDSLSDESIVYLLSSDFMLDQEFSEIDNDAGQFLDGNMTEKLNDSKTDIEVVDLPVVDDYYIYSEISEQDLEEVYSSINTEELFEGD